MGGGAWPWRRSEVDVERTNIEEISLYCTILFLHERGTSIEMYASPQGCLATQNRSYRTSLGLDLREKSSNINFIKIYIQNLSVSVCILKYLSWFQIKLKSLIRKLYAPSTTWRNAHIKTRRHPCTLRESAIFSLRPQIDVDLFIFPSHVYKETHLTNKDSYWE